jgi:hypothetical protein
VTAAELRAAVLWLLETVSVGSVGESHRLAVGLAYLAAQAATKEEP